jgi:hypothetical protein
MQFTLNYQPSRFDFDISHSQKIFLAGSCFAENIGELLLRHRFNALVNPSGILFNPASVLDRLLAALHKRSLSDADIVNREGSFVSYFHHSSVNAQNPTALKQKVENLNAQSYVFLRSAHILILTFGTAFVYRRAETGNIVGNCHKQPSGNFVKQILTVEDISTGYAELIKKLWDLNPQLKIIFTVSPVKYLKDGLVENNLSKATLLLAVDQLVKTNDNCYYFPAYELVNDDLRDYRFYKEDLAHPTPQAIWYVWQKFSGSVFTQNTRRINEHLANIHRAETHRPLGVYADPDLINYVRKQRELVNAIDPSIRF